MTKSKDGQSGLDPEDVLNVVEWIGREINIARMPHPQISTTEAEEIAQFLSAVRRFVLAHPEVTPKMAKMFARAVKAGVSV